MKAIEIISQDLFDKVRSRFENLEMGDETGAVTIDPSQARFFDFDFILEGQNLGRVSISLNDLGSLKVYYSQGITENQDDPTKKYWYSFLREMRLFAMRRLLRFDTRDIAKTNLDKNDFQHLAATQAPKEEEPTMNMNESNKKQRVSENRYEIGQQMAQDGIKYSPEKENEIINMMADYMKKSGMSPKEIRYYLNYDEDYIPDQLHYLPTEGEAGLNESRWNHRSTKKTSRAVKGRTEVIVRHANPVDEMFPGSRSQKKNIKAIFIQNHDGERFKYPFIHPAGAFAMAQHVDHGGIPHDPAGKAIITMSEQIAQLQEFQRKVHSATLHDDATGITERAIGRLHELKSQVDALGKKHHYEAWMAEFNGDAVNSETMLDDVTIEQYKQKFTQTSFQEELSAYFPLLHRIMSETNAINLDDFVKEESEEECETCHKASCECDDSVKEDAFDAFENWAEAVEQGKLTDDQIAELKQALGQLPQGAEGPELELGPEGSTAIQFFQELGLDDEDLANKLKDMANVDPETDALEVFKLWSNESYPELAVALGMSDTTAPAEPPAPAPEQPVAEGPGRMINGKEIDMRSLEIDGVDPRDYPDFSDAYISHASFTDGTDLSDEEMDQLNDEHGDLVYDLAYDSLHENEEQGGMPNQSMPTREGIVKEVAKIVKSFYNADNESVGPFRAEENIALDCKKQVAEKFGDKAGEFAHKLAEQFIEKLSNKWQQKHGHVANGHGDDGLARLKELLGNVKQKVESISPDKEDPPFDPDPPRDGERKDQFGNPIKHVAKHLAKQGMKQVQGDDDGLARLKELLGNVKQKVESMGGDMGAPASNMMPSEEVSAEAMYDPTDDESYDYGSDLLANIRMLYINARDGRNTDPQIAALNNIKDGIEQSEEPRLIQSYNFLMKNLAGGAVTAPKMIMQIADKAHQMFHPSLEPIAQATREAVDKSQVPAYKRKEQGGDWKMSTKDLEKEKTNSPTSSAGLARKKAELGISEELAEIMRLANHKK